MRSVADLTKSVPRRCALLDIQQTRTQGGSTDLRRIKRIQGIILNVSDHYISDTCSSYACLCNRTIVLTKHSAISATLFIRRILFLHIKAFYFRFCKLRQHRTSLLPSRLSPSSACCLSKSSSSSSSSSFICSVNTSNNDSCSKKVNHISSHFLIPLSDSSLTCTVSAQWLVILVIIIVIPVNIHLTFNIAHHKSSLNFKTPAYGVVLFLFCRFLSAHA